MAEHTFDRMAINSAIEHLVCEKEEGWLEAAQQVIDFGIGIRSPTGPVFEVVSLGVTKDEHARGFAAGVGTVEVKEDPKVQTTHTINAEVVRIGRWRVMHFALGHRIKIQHFQKVPPYRLWFETEEFQPDGYDLIYTNDHRPLVFVEIESRAVPKSPPLLDGLIAVAQDTWRHIKCILKLQRYDRRLRIWLRFQHRYRIIHSNRPNVAKGYVSEVFPK